MGNFSIALSGLQAESVALNTIGNNLANLNTTAFKRQTTSFEDLFYQEIGNSGSGDAIQLAPGALKILISSADIFAEDEEWISNFRMLFLSAFAPLLACSAILRSLFFSAAASLSATEKTSPDWSCPTGLPASFKSLQVKRANHFLIARHSLKFSPLSPQMELSDRVWRYW